MRELYDSPSLTLEVAVIKPLWSQMDYDMIRMDFLDNLDTDNAMFPTLRELDMFGQFRIWEVREETFFGLPWDEGMPQPAVPHPPMYWANYWQDNGGSMGSYPYNSMGSHPYNSMGSHFPGGDHEWMDDDSSGSGSGSDDDDGSEEETLVVHFRVAFYDYDSEDWLMVGRDFLRILSNAICEPRPA